MIRLLAKKTKTIKLILPVMLCAFGNNISTAEERSVSAIQFHPYSSYQEFARSSCIPCHYQNIPNGTDLAEFFSGLSEEETKVYLTRMLKDGNMPPDKLYREVLYLKFLRIK